jgi:hypothetical protein
MGSPNKDAHLRWVTSFSREDMVYEYPKLSMEELDTLEEYVHALLSTYEEGNERVDVAEMICTFASIFASRSPQEQMGILTSALEKSEKIHEELKKEDMNKDDQIKKLMN